MKKYQRVFFAALLILHLGVLAEAAELKDGFMGYKWGESISMYDELTWLYAKKDVSYYSSRGQSYTIDDTVVDDVIFGFYKGDFFAVYIGINSLEKHDEVKRYLQAKYGLPSTQVSTKDQVTTNKWKYQGVSIKLKTSEISGKMKLAFYKRSLSRFLQKEQLDELNEGSVQFFPIDKNKRPEKVVPLLTF